MLHTPATLLTFASSPGLAELIVNHDAEAGEQGDFAGKPRFTITFHWRKNRFLPRVPFAIRLPPSATLPTTAPLGARLPGSMLKTRRASGRLRSSESEHESYPAHAQVAHHCFLLHRLCLATRITNTTMSTPMT
uniref:Uncharacterized protein n=1 Tax=Mycena chlorophos TaxID=658473 RepID=A0ABQ0L524_MYCCL|nr:predicted protein [Mycena chlorophos]